jgi:hypothetical protein
MYNARSFARSTRMSCFTSSSCLPLLCCEIYTLCTSCWLTTFTVAITLLASMTANADTTALIFRIDSLKGAEYDVTIGFQ